MDRADDLAGVKVKGAEQELIQGLPDQRRGQRTGREIGDIVSDDDVGAACSCRRHHVPVTRIREPDGVDE
ncbi:MAG TPA: hypothetical protein VHO07_26785 [Streptosporangiaceae bacterium]|nr:hypothetical protein [Streptosporangiaceae bacterium]